MKHYLMIFASLTVTPGVALSQSLPKARVAPVTWPSDVPVSVAAGKKISPDIDKVLFPVLIPKPFLLADLVAFAADEVSYTATVADGDRSISISGTRIRTDLNGASKNKDAAMTAGEPAPKVADGSVSEDERVAFAKISKYGAAYTVEIECGNDSDRGCDDDAIAKSYIQALEMVGGTRGEPTTKPEPPKEMIPDLVSASSLPAGWDPPAGQLVSVGGKPSGKGVVAKTIYAPGIRFPVEIQPAYLNSQVYSLGGSLGPKSPHGWADEANYAYPWHDNFCESRPRSTPRCPGGKGHQGQDIRPAHPPKFGTYYAVATEDGYIAKVGSWMVVLMGASGTRYNYLHMSKASLSALGIIPGKRMKRGEKMGAISNEFGGTPTSVHLHFEMMQNLNGQGMVHVPPYTSLVAAYGAM